MSCSSPSRFFSSAVYLLALALGAADQAATVQAAGQPPAGAAAGRLAPLPSDFAPSPPHTQADDGNDNGHKDDNAWCGAEHNASSCMCVEGEKHALCSTVL
eukprot:1140306-Pelagomonas_calceolata.AAC.4